MTTGVFIAGAKGGIAARACMRANDPARPSSSRALLLLICP